MTNAFHSSSNNDGAYMGEPCGIVVRAEGKSVYFAGDTCVFGDMALIGRLYKPDLAVLPIGDYYTMGPEEAALALELLGVKRCVPCHWGTFPPLVGRPETLQELAPGREGRDDRAGRVGHRMRERWWGASGRQVPELAVEGDPAVPVEEALVVDSPHDPAEIHAAFEAGTPVVVRAATAEDVRAALARPEVASVLVPAGPGRPPRSRPDGADVWRVSPIVATYSIAACDLEAKQWGVAVQSKFLSVGSVVPWAEPEVGAIATQAYANPRYGPNGLALLREGLSAAEVVERLTAADDGRDARQLGIVDGEGRSASWTGPECNDWAGHLNGPCYAAQGNILVGAETVDALAETFEANANLPLAQRLLECLAAAQAAGGDRRGQQSASLLVVERDGGYASLSDIVVDLRVEDHARPIEELRRIYGLHRRLFEVTPREEWLPLEGELRTEVDERLARLGYATLDDWAGVENLEERVDGEAMIDPVVLEALREAS